MVIGGQQYAGDGERGRPLANTELLGFHRARNIDCYNF